MPRFTGFIAGGALVGLVIGVVAGQDGSAKRQAPLRHGDSVTLQIGEGGSGRITLPGGDTVIPGDRSTLSTLTNLDAEGAARTMVNLESGSFQLEGRGGGPRIQVLGLGLLPGVGSVNVTVDGTGSHIEHTDGGPVVLRLGTEPDAARIVLAEGGAIDIQRNGKQLVVSVADGATGRVLLSGAGGWSQLEPGAAIETGADPSAPSLTRGKSVSGVKPPEVPTVQPASGSEEIAAKLGTGGSATLRIADGSMARAEAGAEVVATWSGGPADRQATISATAGTVRASLRTPRTTAETPSHRIRSDGPASLTMTITAEGERLEVGRNGAAAIITNALPHQGPSIQMRVQPGDAIEFVAGDPAQGIRYRIPNANGAAVEFNVGSKRLSAPAGTEVIFRPNGQVEVRWPEGPEELFRFAFAPETLLPSVNVPYTGLPDLLPPLPVSPSTP